MTTITSWITIWPGREEWLVEISLGKVIFNRIGVIERSREAPHPDVWYVSVPAEDGGIPVRMQTIAARPNSRKARNALKDYYEKGFVAH